MAYTETMTNLSNEAKTWYDRTLLDRAKEVLVHDQAAQKKSIPQRGGINVEFRRFGALSAATTALTEGTNPSGSNVAVTTVTATVDQYGDYVVGSDILETQSIDNVLTEITEVQGDQAGLTFDVLCREELATTSNVYYANGAGSRGDVGSGDWFNLTELRRIERLLSRNKAMPIRGNRFMVFIHTDAYTDFVGDTVVNSILQNAGQRGPQNPIFKGEVGEISRSVLVETPNAKVYASLGQGGADVYAAVGVGKNAYGAIDLAAHQLTTVFVPAQADHGDRLGLTWVKGWKGTYVAKILNGDWVVKVEHAASYPY